MDRLHFFLDALLCDLYADFHMALFESIIRLGLSSAFPGLRGEMKPLQTLPSVPRGASHVRLLRGGLDIVLCDTYEGFFLKQPTAKETKLHDNKKVVCELHT